MARLQLIIAICIEYSVFFWLIFKSMIIQSSSHRGFVAQIIEVCLKIG